MKIKSFAAAAAIALSLGAVERASAAPIVLTFEGIPDETAIGDYYNGGGGTNYGVSFGPDSLALVSQDDGGTGNFNEAPAPGDTIAFFLGGSGDVMNVAAGFTTGFSFYYVSPNDSGTVSVYSGLNDTGALLATVNLPTTPAGGPGCDTGYCPFEIAGVSFTGVAMSADFNGVADQIGFDNITLGSSTPGGVPEPATWAMMLVGFGGLGAGMRAHRRTNREMAGLQA